MIKRIEHLRAELYTVPISEREVLGDSDVPILVAWAPDWPAAGIRNRKQGIQVIVIDE